MRMSCNGCRALRKACSETCSIRPCLQFLKSPDAQANATLFLAKFYGRAGLLNLIDAGPSHLRPAIFRSLLYEACGRIVNPTYGSVGLLWSGRWQLCQAAMEAVLNDAPIMQISPSDAAAAAADITLSQLRKASSYDIRHIAGCRGTAPYKVKKAVRSPFKRSGSFHVNAVRTTALPEPSGPLHFRQIATGTDEVSRVNGSYVWSFVGPQREPSRGSTSSAIVPGMRFDKRDAFLPKTAAAPAFSDEYSKVQLDLTLGFASSHHSHGSLQDGGGSGSRGRWKPQPYHRRVGAGWAEKAEHHLYETVAPAVPASSCVARSLAAEI